MSQMRHERRYLIADTGGWVEDRQVQHLPPTLSTLDHEIRKGSCRGPQIADGIGVGKGGWMESIPEAR